MVRPRVFSFRSRGTGSRPASPPSPSVSQPQVNSSDSPHHSAAPYKDSPSRPASRQDRVSSRPLSMVQTYQPHLADITSDTIPELQPIFTFLNSHSNKLYSEGYFLKLNDLDPSGKPCTDRAWVECFAQLVGTVLSLWDATALDAAGDNGEVMPAFINLTDASLKMIDTLPTRSSDSAPLQHVLSISTAGKNRYLFHFNSHHSVKQWTAAIRLAMFENTTLLEAYTGSLIAGKGKLLNNIKQIMMPLTRFPYEDWVRVRFGAGTPWRRCWCVITPPDAKMAAKQRKEERKEMKRSAYRGMSKSSSVKGEIRFYDSKKVKKVQPIAIINDAFSAHAIYPQSKPLIDQSTLIKVEGLITIKSSPPTSSDGFVFVMPEVHAAVSGFEMMLRWLFPAFDTFNLYGRPNALVADTRDTRSLMFAMPQERRYGYLEIMDVVGLMSAEGSNLWREHEWRNRLKELTARRFTALASSGPTQRTSQRVKRNSMPSRPGIMFADQPRSDGEMRPKRSASIGHQDNKSSPAVNVTRDAVKPAVSPVRGYYRAESAPPTPIKPPPSGPSMYGGYPRIDNDVGLQPKIQVQRHESDNTSASSEDDPSMYSDSVAQQVDQLQPTAPVAAPPQMSHNSTDRPLHQPQMHHELRRTRSRMSSETLAQLANANPSSTASAGAMAAWNAAEFQPRRPAEPMSLRSGRRSTENLKRGIMNSGFDRGQGDAPDQGMRAGLPIPSLGRRLPAIMGSPAVGSELSEYFANPVTPTHPLPSVPEPDTRSGRGTRESSRSPQRLLNGNLASLRPSRVGPKDRYGAPTENDTLAPPQPPTPFSDSARQVASRSQSPIKRKVISHYVTNSNPGSAEPSPTRDAFRAPPSPNRSPNRLQRKPLVSHASNISQ